MTMLVSEERANLFPRLDLSTCFEEAWFMQCRCALHIATKRACYLFFLSSVVFPQKKIMILSSSLISPFHIFSSSSATFCLNYETKRALKRSHGCSSCRWAETLFVYGLDFPGTLTLLPFLRGFTGVIFHFRHSSVLVSIDMIFSLSF